MHDSGTGCISVTFFGIFRVLFWDMLCFQVLEQASYATLYNTIRELTENSYIVLKRRQPLTFSSMPPVGMNLGGIQTNFGTV